MKGILLSFPFISFRFICIDWRVRHWAGPRQAPAQRALSLGDLSAESDDRGERRLGLVGLRRVAAGLEDEARHGGGRAGLDGADLLQRSILIVRALDDERGNTPATDRILDVPGLEAGVEPGIVPARSDEHTSELQS